MREFVRSARFSTFSRLVDRVLAPEACLSPEEDERARNMAAFINRDLTELAQVAAETERPFVVTAGEFFDHADIVRDLGMIGRAVSLNEACNAPVPLQRRLFELVDYHQKLVDTGEQQTRTRVATERENEREKKREEFLATWLEERPPAS